MTVYCDLNLRKAYIHCQVVTALFSRQKFAKIVTEMEAGCGYTILYKDIDFVNKESHKSHVAQKAISRLTCPEKKKKKKKKKQKREREMFGCTHMQWYNNSRKAFE